MNQITIILTEIEVNYGVDKAWYGRAPGLEDNNGNEIDCQFPTAAESLASITEQLKEFKHI